MVALSSSIKVCCTITSMAFKNRQHQLRCETKTILTTMKPKPFSNLVRYAYGLLSNFQKAYKTLKWETIFSVCLGCM